MLNLTSRFVLERLPYLLVALAAAVLLPRAFDRPTPAPLSGATSSHRPIAAAVEPFGPAQMTLDRIRHDHAAFAPDLLSREIARAAEAEPVVR